MTEGEQCDKYTELDNIIVIVVGYLNNEHYRYAQVHVFSCIEHVVITFAEPVTVG